MKTNSLSQTLPVILLTLILVSIALTNQMIFKNFVLYPLAVLIMLIYNQQIILFVFLSPINKIIELTSTEKNADEN